LLNGHGGGQTAVLVHSAGSDANKAREFWCELVVVFGDVTLACSAKMAVTGGK
jgi:hypothetical protein